MEAEKDTSSRAEQANPQSQPPSTTASEKRDTSTDLAVTDDANTRNGPQDTFQQPSTAKVSLVLFAVLTSMFVVALDRTIIATVCMLLFSITSHPTTLSIIYQNTMLMYDCLGNSHNDR
jgi:hypothetical protein